jgi:hypothetical protein
MAWRRGGSGELLLGEEVATPLVLLSVGGCGGSGELRSG